MKQYFLLFLLICLAGICWGDETMTLTADEAGQLKISRLEVRSIVNGSIARTELTATFYNHTDRVLSGELIVPLSENAVINGFGLDINGTMVDGVIVEKDKGRQVFETIQRQGIDPGLLEKVSGNNFRTRVFPLPPKGYRTVKISWVHALPKVGGLLSYQLPLSLEKKVDSFSLNLEVVKAAVKPNVLLKGIDQLKTAKVRDSYIVSAEESNIRLNGDLKLFLPDVAENRLVVEKGSDGYSYFVLFADAESGSTSAVRNPGRFTLYWDASSSMTEEKRAKGLDFLSELFTRWRKCTVDVFVLREKVEKAGQFKINRGNGSDLISFLEKLDYDGASALKTLPEMAGSSELGLLVSDGLNNFGKNAVSGSDRPLYSAAVGQGADYTFLRSLAYTSGGAFVNLETGTTKSTVSELLASGDRYTCLSDGRKGILELYPVSQQVSGERIMISGRFSGRGEFYYTTPQGKKARVSVSDSDAAEGYLARTFFGMQKLADKLLDPDTGKDEIIAIGRTYSLATPTTSFIVLDNIDQYLRYNIEPPASMPDWRKLYFETIQARQQQENDQTNEKISRMLELWKQKVQWWNTEFKYPKDYRHSEESDKTEGGDHGGDPDAEDEPHGGGPDMPSESAAGNEGEGFARQRSSEPMSAMSGDMEESLVQDMSDAEAPEMKKEDRGGADQNKSAITINAWTPDTPYLQKLKAAAKPYAAYLELKKEFGKAPSFYLDCGDFFENAKQTELAVRVWSNIAEMDLDNYALLRNLGHRLQQAGSLEFSEQVFRKVVELRPEEPQSYRDLALVLADESKYAEAVALLYKVVITPWQRFEEIELIALDEMNNIIGRFGKDIPNDTMNVIDKRFIQNLVCDVRVILTWDADLTDMDLWVTEPSGEKAYYGNRNTVIGASFSRDFTQGYGPEEYLLKKAMKGKYKIEVNYYSSSALSLSGTVTLQIDVFTDYGTAKQQKQSITIRLKDKQETLEVGEIEM